MVGETLRCTLSQHDLMKTPNLIMCVHGSHCVHDRQVFNAAFKTANSTYQHDVNSILFTCSLNAAIKRYDSSAAVWCVEGRIENVTASTFNRKKIRKTATYIMHENVDMHLHWNVVFQENARCVSVENVGRRAEKVLACATNTFLQYILFTVL